MEFITNNAVLILGLLLALSELLAAIPSVKSNSVFQLISSGVKFFYDKMVGKKS